MPITFFNRASSTGWCLPALIEVVARTPRNPPMRTHPPRFTMLMVLTVPSREVRRSRGRRLPARHHLDAAVRKLGGSAVESHWDDNQQDVRSAIKDLTAQRPQCRAVEHRAAFAKRRGFVDRDPLV